MVEGKGWISLTKVNINIREWGRGWKSERQRGEWRESINE
jgi:hypothetical protein